MTEIELERLLALGLVVVYLVDATRLLRNEEALVEFDSGGHWRVLFGLVGFELGGRRLCWPNLIRPDRPLVRVRWHLGKAADPAKADDRHPSEVSAMATQRLGVLCLILLLLIVCAAPILLWLGRAQAFAVVALIAYGVSLAAGALLTVQAPKFGLSRLKAAGLALIGLICLPCAPNLLRTALGGMARAVTLPAFARDGADDGEWSQFRQRFARVLTYRAALFDPDSEEGRRMQSELDALQVTES